MPSLPGNLVAVPVTRLNGVWKLSQKTMVSVVALVGSLLAGQAVASDWVPITSFTPRNMPGVAEVDGKIYVVGGIPIEGGSVLSTVDIYDMAADGWVSGPDLHTARYALALGSANGNLYAIGGGLHTNARTAVVEEYTPGDADWVDKVSMTVARMEMAVATVNGKIYAMGGDIVGTVTDIVEEYDPDSDTWTTHGCPLPSPRQVRSGADVFANEIYVFGGHESSYLNTVYKHDPEAAGCVWTQLADMPQAQQKHGVVERNGIFLIAGGDWGQVDGVPTVRAYDASNDTWGLLPDLPIPDRAGDLLNVGGILYYVSSLTGTIYEYQETVPAVSDWGLIVMTLLVLTSGTLVYTRRRPAQA